MKDVVFVSCCFGNFLYFQQMDRLEKSIKRIYPKANIMLFRGTDKNTSTEGLPPGARSFMDSMYGFKPHAIAEAKKRGFKKVIWLDPAMLLVSKIDRFFNHHMIAAIDESQLSNTISDKFLKYKGLTKEVVSSRGWHLVGGSFYYFDFETQAANNIFNDWMESEKLGYFGSQYEAASEQINSHRNDESCMAVAMYSNGISPSGHDDIGYCVENNPVFKKRHFK